MCFKDIGPQPIRGPTPFHHLWLKISSQPADLLPCGPFGDDGYHDDDSKCDCEFGETNWHWKSHIACIKTKKGPQHELKVRVLSEP
jgi:hypothetical protein